MLRLSKERRETLNDVYGITSEHLAHYEALIELLRSDKIPPPRFDIKSYIDNPTIGSDSPYFKHLQPYEFTRAVNMCGTTACAIGHAPMIYPPLDNLETWRAYEKRLFGVSRDDLDYQQGSAWEFMFGGKWRGYNNTALGTAARIEYFLKSGFPPHYIGSEWHHQNGRMPSPWITDKLKQRIDAEKARLEHSEQA